MDDLLAEVGGGDSGIGLNIICDAPAASTTAGHAGGGPNKRRKKNKYERRRAKARQAKEEQEREKLMSFAPKSGGDAEPKVVETVTKPSASAMDEDKAVPAEEDEHAVSSDADAHEDKARDDIEVDQSNSQIGAINDNDDSASEGSSEEVSEGESEDEDEDDGPAPSASSTASDAPQKLSRRVHDATLLEDERKRADYMATFHARPHEIDRRSNASGRIKESRASNHIFEADDEDEDEEEASNNSRDGNNSEDGVGENDEAMDLDDKQEDEDTAPKCPFEAIGLHPRLAKAVSSERGFGYDRPTIIQTNAARALIGTNKNGGRKKKPKASSDKLPNLFVQSETGSGKTLAYLLPIVQSLAVDSATNDLKKVDRQIGGTRCIILCPTRELATQTATMAEKLCLKSFNWLVPGCLSGGEKRKSEKARLRKGVSILVATPGRLLDHITKTDCLLMSLKGKLEWLVLDEADRLLDMGLGGQVETIVQHIRANQPRSGVKRNGITWRSVLVSATVTPKIEDLAKKSLGGDTWVWARAKKGKGGGLDADEGGNELAHSAPKQLAQLHLTCSAKLRLPTLVAFLTARVQKGERIVVFMSTCDGVEFYHSLFSKMGCILPRDNDEDDGNSDRGGIFGDACSMFRLHGNVPHAERQTILKKFGSTSSKKASILFATDVAARGLNLPGLDWIVQYDAPCETADYVHRAGRAARAGKAGHALLFLLPSEKQFLEVLEIRGMKEMSALSLSATLNGAADICGELTAEGVKRSGGGYGSGSGSRSGEAFAAAIQNKLEECIVEDEATYKDNLRKSLEQRKTKGANKILKNAIGELHEAAIKAYSAHIRSYPAKEKAVRHIFSPRALHLGHVARSFALKEQPKALSGKRRAAEGSDDEDEDILKSTGRKRNARLAFGGKGKQGDDGNGKEAATKAAGGGNKKVKKKKSLAESSDIAALEDIMKGTKKKKGKSSNKANDFGFGYGDKQSAGANQKKMLAMAQRMQGSGLSEFF